MPDLWTSRISRPFCPRSRDRIREIEEFIFDKFSGLASDQDVMGVAVNVDLDRTTSNSDIDVLIVAREAKSEPVSSDHIGLLDTDVQWINESRVLAALQNALVDLKSLREIARLANSLIIWERDAAITRLQSMATRVALVPSDAAVLLLKAAACLHAAQHDATLSDAILKVRGAAYALSTLAIATTPQRYEKPKWILNTLRRYRFNQLADSICDLLGCSDPFDEERIAIEPARHLILQMCGLAGWPRLVRAERDDTDYAYIYRTYRDAESLLQARMVQDAVITADYALRLCHVVGSRVLSHQSQQSYLRSWSANRDRLVKMQYQRSRAPVLQHVGSLKRVGYELQETYKAQVRRVKRGAA